MTPARAPRAEDPFDVVVVPDFSGARAVDFEARTLFFLASWIENAGRARDYPLHLACIGEPPASVGRLAGECGAAVTVHRPLDLEAISFANKLRGFEVARRTDRLLLLDADVFALSDLASFGALGDRLAVSPASMPQIPGRSWRRIYRGLDVEAPTERIPCMRTRLGLGRWPILAYARQNADMQGMVPFFNAGVIFMPWDCGLVDLWPVHMRTISTLFGRRGRRLRRVNADDQAALATAVTALRARGTPFEQLPLAFHTNWMALYSGRVPFDQMRIFHAYRFCSGLGPDREAIGSAIQRFRALMRKRIGVEAFLEHGVRLRLAAHRRTLAAAERRLDELVLRLEDLQRRHVAPALGL